jgi:Ran GTPase-activating protein (RanGAP) involved in mRNA processing and transport
LNLTFNGITDEGVEALCISLYNNHSLKRLCLADNKITNYGADQLASLLEANVSLTDLSLRYNLISCDGAARLAEALTKNTTLTNLDLRTNKIKEDGAMALFEALCENTALTELDLQGNSAAMAGAESLAAALRTNTALERIHLSHNSITDAGGALLASTLRQQNHTVVQISLSGNGLRIGTQKELTKAASSNQARPGWERAGVLGRLIRDDCTLEHLQLRRKIQQAGGDSWHAGSKGRSSGADKQADKKMRVVLKAGKLVGEQADGKDVNMEGASYGEPALNIAHEEEEEEEEDAAVDMDSLWRVCKMVGRNRALRSLGLAQNGIDSNGTVLVASMLLQQRQHQLHGNNAGGLDTLDLSDNVIGEEGGGQIGIALSSSSPPGMLVDMHPHLSAGGGAAGAGAQTITQTRRLPTPLSTPVAAGAATTAGRRIQLTETTEVGELTSTRMGEMKAALTNMGRTQSMDDESDGEGAEGAHRLILPPHPLRRLSLRNTRLGDEGARALVTALVGESPEDSRAASVARRHSGRHSMSDGHQRPNNLEYVDLGSNRLSAEGASSIARLLQVPSTSSALEGRESRGLKQLDLSNNMLGDQGAGEIARALGGGQLGGEGADVAGGGMAVALTSLNLQLNNISDMGAFLLGTALQANESLTELDLRHNSISPEMLALVNHGLERNRARHFAAAAAKVAEIAESTATEITSSC